MVVVSLFDGMSGAQLALQKANIPVTTYYASEVDKHAIKVTQDNFPNTIQLGDVTKITKDQFPEGVDLLVGGSPCTDLSIAKSNRKSLEGDASGLFYEYHRLLKELKPKWFLLENVASMNRESKAAITELMGVDCIAINSSGVSHQKRKRLYWTNIPYLDTPFVEMGHLSSIIENLSECVCKDVSLNIKATAVLDYFYEYMTRSYEPHDGFKKLVAWSRSTRYPVNELKYVEDRVSFDKANTLTTGSGCGSFSSKNYVIQHGYIRHLTILECKRLQTIPDNYKMNVSNAQAYKMIGNGFTVDVVVNILKGMVRS